MIVTFLLYGCATHGTSDLRKKAVMIQSGMNKEEVVNILGNPGNRQFSGKKEAWQYKSYGMLEDDLHIVWFDNGKVVSYTTESRKDLPFGFNYKETIWDRPVGSPLNVVGASTGGIYAGVGVGHWVAKNIDGGTLIVLEDGSLWQINPFERINAALWLPISNISVTESTSGSLSYNYLLVNTDDGEKAHAKYLGQR